MSKIATGRSVVNAIYRLDVAIVRLRKALKKILPSLVVLWVQRRKDKKENRSIALLGDVYPWMSPNIWDEIVGYYRNLDAPIIVEFGTGASTIAHLLEMMKLEGAIYIGIENDPSWFWVVVASLIDRAQTLNVGANFKLHGQGLISSSENNIDVEINIQNVKLLLKLRTSEKDYIAAFNHVCDVVIIDGIIRQACVQAVLHSNYVKNGGLVMLMEAGRGSPDWWEGKLYGCEDYSREVKDLIALGGVLLDGNGVDSWPGCKRKSPRPISYYCPLEACKLIKPF
jgi:hypothetical protein